MIKIHEVLFTTSNGVVWNKKVDNIFKRKKRKINYEHIPIGQKCYFVDDIWDLTEYNKVSDEKRKYILSFKGINNNYKNFVKDIILKKLVLSEVKVPTAGFTLCRIRSFVQYLSKNYINDPSLINIRVVSRFFEKNEWTNSTSARYKADIVSLLDSIKEVNVSLNFEEVYDYLHDMNYRKIAVELENNKYKLIPFDTFNKIVSLAIIHINSMNELIRKGEKLKKEQITDVMSSCMVVILAETGMRIGEFHKLEINRIKEINIRSENKKIFYLEFLTYKTTPEIDGHWTMTYMTDSAILAYKTLEIVTNGKRKKTNSKYLYLSNSGVQYQNISTLQKHMFRFFDIFQSKINFKKLSIDELSKYKCMDVTKEKKQNWYNGCLRNMEIGSKLYYVTAHQFRVTVATILYKRGISLEFIRRHMNHLSSEMTQQYIRVSEIEKNKGNIIESILMRSSQDGTRLETEKYKIENEEFINELNILEYKEAYNNINRFMINLNKTTSKSKKLNVYSDVSDIIDMFIARSPITETELGYCVRDSLISICKHQEFLSEVYNGLFLAPYIPSIENLTFNYKSYLEKKSIVNHDKEMVNINKSYINEYQRELKGLKFLIERRVLPDISVLKHELAKSDINRDSVKFSEVGWFIDNISEIEKEVAQWI